MKTFLTSLLRFTITAIVVVAALFAAWWLWVYYHVDPWTRDGRIRADVVMVAPDVSGLVTEVYVHDNQRVVKGQLLFVIDRPRYALALAQAEETIAADRVLLAQAQREDRRNKGLGALVAVEVIEQGETHVQQLSSSLAQAMTARDVARLNLDRTSVRASVDGTVTNVELRPGDFLPAGRQALALIDAGSLHVDGYFEETKLSGIWIGDKAEIHIMGETATVDGHVESIAAGIDDRERGPSGNLLPNVNPTFSWVRLAQRIPVRIAIDRVPRGVRLIAGRTATVTVVDQRHETDHNFPFPAFFAFGHAHP